MIRKCFILELNRVGQTRNGPGMKREKIMEILKAKTSKADKYHTMNIINAVIAH